MRKINTKRVLLVPYKKLHELDMEVKTLRGQALEVQKDLAIKDLDLYEFIDLVNVQDNILQECYALVYDTSEDYIFIQMGEHDDSTELVVNNHAEFHIRRENNAYSVDVYKYYPQNSDHDFDQDDVWEMGWVFDDDINDLSYEEGSEDEE